MPDYFDTPRDYIFIVPILNLELTKKNFKVGDVKFYKFTKYHKIKHLKILKNILLQNPNYQNNKKLIKSILNGSQKELNINENKICAEITVNDNLEDAYEKALHRIRMAINILKLYRYSNSDSQRCYFGMEGEVIPYKIRLALRYSKELRGTKNTLETVGFLFPYSLDSDRIKRMKKLGFRELVKIFKNPNPNDLEKRLLTAIYWHGMSHNRYTTEEARRRRGFVFRHRGQTSAARRDYNYYDSERFVKCMMALEALFIFDKSEPITSSVAERVSFILGKNYDERQNIYKVVKSLYEIRSSIVHGGETRVEKARMQELFHVVNNCILVLLTYKKRFGIKDKEDLRKWLLKKKLT